MKRLFNFQFSILVSLLLLAGGSKAWGQTYQYYAIHNKDKGYLKQVNGNVAIDNTFRYENSHDGNGSSIWVLSSDGYLQQEMYYLNVANDQTLYLSTEKVTQWIPATEGEKTYLKPSGSTKFLCADSGPQLKAETSYKLNACEMTIEENSGKWEGPKDVSFTVQSPQLVTYMRTYYIRNITATITKDDAGSTNKKVVDKKDSRCFCSLTYSTTTDANKGIKWDINETSGVIYSKQASGNYSVVATYSVAPLDPIALSLHPAADKTVTLTLQPSPITPDADKNYLLFYTKNQNFRFPYDDGSLSEGDAVKTNASRSVLTEPSTSPNNNISWKIVRDDEGFYSFRNVNSGRWLRYDDSHYVAGSDYGVIEMGVNGDATPTGNEYKFRLYKLGTYKNTSSAPTYCILPYSKQYAIYKSDGAATNAFVAMSVYTTPSVISLNKAGDDSKYCIFAYEAEDRIYGSFTLSGPNSAVATGDYVFNTTKSYSSRNIVGSPSNDQDLEINGSYSEDISFTWQVQGHDGYITVQTPTVSSGKGTQVVTVNSLPSGTLYGKVRVQAKSTQSKYSGWKELEFNLYGEPSYTDITSLSEITSSDGYYRLTADVSDAPGVTEFSGFLDGNMHKISSVSAPLFTTLTGTVKNLVLESVSISSGDSDGNTGAIACKANGDARIYNVGILGGSVSGTEYTGGLVGFLDGSARVINCFSYANVSGGSYVGGIVGYNNVATTATNLKTMVMNCMFYGEVSGSSIAPIYNGKIITNVGKNAGVSNFNYFRLESSYIQNTDITKVYNCALGAETRFLQRFEFFRHVLNSHRELAAWWATGSMDNKDKMMKWVLEPSQIGSSTPYPILKTPGYYPSVVNLDAENAPTTTERNKGGKMSTLTVNIQMGSGGAQFAPPTGAEIVNSSLTLNITDKDPEHFNFNYYKVQLPYYNDVGTKNYTGNRVVTGWKIVGITGGTPGSFTTGDDAPAYNFADRNCTNKDLYGVSGRVFNQGAYWDVPEGVTAITIQPYWAKAAYVADAYPDVVYNANMTEAYDVSNVGGGQKYTNNTDYNIAGEQQRVFTSISEAVTNADGLNKPTDNSVHDYAVVLVGNVHQYTGNNVAIGSNYKYTVTTIDLDHDNEPDYSLMLRNDGRNKLHPAKWDFLNIVGLGMAQKSTGGTGSYNQGIFQPLYWFETTNTSLFRVTQFEYDNTSRIEAPLILQGGVMEQWVSGQSGGRSNNTTYFHVGGNVWFKEFHRGTHQDQTYDSKHPPVSVTGGDYDEFYLTGLYTANVASYADNAECYINGGRFGIVAGAAMEGIGKANGADNTGNITWQVQNADIREFYAGGINAAKPVTGNLNTTITGGKIDLFCGGPKFGDMSTGKTVTTNATNCIFGTFFGAGYGGNSYSRQAPRNHNNMINFPHNDGQAGNDASWNAWLGRFYTQSYSDTYGGVSTQFSYQFLPMSGNADNCGRIFVEYVKFSLATCRNVTSTLTGCKITGNFYGGGSLGKVDGPVASTLTNCEVQGSVFGAGFSASLPSVEVDATGFATEPYYYTDLGTYRMGVKGPTTTYTWQKKTGDSWVDNTNHILYTPEDLTALGAVTGTATLTIDGTTTVAESVYGGGEESGVGGNTTVNVTGGTIGTTGKGGATWGNVYGGGKGKSDDVSAGLVKGNTNVTVSGSPAIIHNVYGGGAFGSVGTFTYNATTGLPNGFTENTGTANVTITGGTFGSNGKDNGMVFGSSRGSEGDPDVDSYVDKIAWVANTNVTIGDTNEDTSPSIKGSVYGGGENGHNYKDAHVTIHKGTIGITDPEVDGGARYPTRGNVYGAGCGTDTFDRGEGDNKKTYYDFNAGIVLGNTYVDIDGGHIVHNVYGGGAMGTVGTYTLADDAYHTAHPEVPVGKPLSCAENTGLCTINITGGKIGITDATMTDHGTDGPDDCGHVFGAGRGSCKDPDKYPNVEYCAFFNNTQLTIGGTALVCGSVYGGSESGHVLNNTNVTISGGQIGCGEGRSEAYSDTDFESESLPATNHWTYEDDGAPYDQYADMDGKYPDGSTTEGGKPIATDGRTFYGNVFAGGSGYYPYAPGKWLRSAGHIEGDATVTVTGGHILNNLYGGSEMADIGGAVTVNMNGGTVGVPRTKAEYLASPNCGYIFGGGMGDKRIFFNTRTNVSSTLVNVTNGTVYGSVYGGGEDGHVLHDAAVNITPGESKTVVIGCDGKSGYDGNVFGGGQGSPTAQTAGVISGDVRVTVTGGTMSGSVYGGGRLASVGTYLVPADNANYGKLIPDDWEQVVDDEGIETDVEDPGRKHGEITMTVNGGTIKGSVFGAGKGDRRTMFNTWTNVKSTSVTITSANIGGSVFGGGEDGHVLRDAVTRIDPAAGKTIVIGADDGEDNGNVFGGGQGSTTALTAGVVSGNVTLDIKGGTMYGSVYGGGRLAAVGTFLVPPTAEKYGTFIPDGWEQVVINDGPGDVVEAEGRKHGNITVNLTGGTIHGDVFGACMGTLDDEHGTANILGISRNIKLYLNEGVATTGVKGCVVKGNIFGCNNMNASPKGTVDVHIYATQNDAATQIANAGVVTNAKVDGRYDVKAVYGGGNMAAYVPEDLTTGKTNVTIDGCQLTSIQQVYGGGNAASTPATSVTVNGTYEIEEVFGGGNGKDDIVISGETKPNPGANVGFYDYSAVEDQYPTKESRQAQEFIDNYVYGTGAASVNIFGGTIHRVFGGSNTKGNVKNTAITLLDENSGCDFCVDEAYGGGKSAPMDAEAKLLMACIPGLQAVYGGAEAADVHGDVTLNITNGTFKRVFGGNNISGTIDGAIKVNIEEVGCRPIIIGELYGGGNQAAYSIYGYNDDGTPKTEGENPSADPQVNLKAFTSIGAVYGGGYGTTATMVGSPTVNINEVEGTPDTYPTSGTDGSIGGTFTATGYSGATGVVVDTETGHTVDIPAHVRGKIGAVGNVFGGGNAAQVMGSTTVNVGNLSTIDFESTTAVEALPVKGADIKGNIYGGGDAAEVTGNASVNVGKKKVENPEP